jgi:hypothetical protein
MKTFASLDHQVAALDDRDAHLAGEEGVLEVGAVVDAGRQQDDVRLVERFGAMCRSDFSSISE